MARLNESRMISAVGDAFGVSAADSMFTTMHAQHGVTVLVGVETEIVVTGGSGEAWAGRVVVVPPDVPHAVASPGPLVGLLYDPEELPHVAGYARAGGPRPLFDGFAMRVAHMIARERAALDRRDVLDGLGREVAAALGRLPVPHLDRRVRRALEALQEPAANLRTDTSLGSIVAESGLGEAHLQALFARDVGVPMRTYRLWRRLLVATLALRTVEATHAAHAAGFADLAHFSRTCRRMLGHTPSQMRAALTTR